MDQKEKNTKFYRSLYRIRRVEEEIARIYPSDKIKSPVHLSVGQEAVSVGVCEALLQDDTVFGSYRSHAMYLAKGGDMNRMIAELYGKSTGVAGGKGGSMHLVDVEHSIMGTSAVVATTIPEAVGYAYGLKVQKKKNIVVCFFGDGATDEGVFYESLNFAALKSLPIIFICENNFYAIHTHQNLRQSKSNIRERAAVMGMPAETIEDDVFKVNERVAAAADALRAGEPGPYFFECLTYRWKEHVGPNDDFNIGYRTLEEAEPWFKNDQVKRVAGMVTEAERMQIEQEVETEIQAAFEFAENSPFPDKSELLTQVFRAN